MKALIADDDVFVRKCLIKMLPWQEMGFETPREARDGIGALNVAKEYSPDLVISDVKMPGMSGLELAEQLRASMVDVYVIILSEYSDFEFVQRALKSNVGDYILKPITKERLNEISDKIREMTLRMELKRNYAALENGSDGIREMVRDMLVGGDVRACAEAFEYMALSSIPKENIKPFGSSFLRELYQQAQLFSHKKQELENECRAALETYSGLKNVADMIALVKDSCAQCARMCARQTAKAPNYVDMIDAYIEENYADPDLSVASVSDWLHLSAVYTGTLYKQQKGVSIINRINEVRLEKARQLLLDEDANVRTISQRVGYVTPDYFSRLFGAYYGMSPSQYRVTALKRGENGT